MNIVTNIHAQNYFSKVDVCDSCSYSIYLAGDFYNSKLYIFGQLKDTTSESFFYLIKKNTNGSDILQKSFKTISTSYNAVFNRVNDKFYLKVEHNKFDTINSAFIVYTKVYQFDTNLNIVRNFTIDSSVSDRTNFFRKCIFRNNHLEFFGEVTDSISTAYSQHIGYMVYDTSGVLLEKRNFPIVSSNVPDFKNVEYINGIYYLMGFFDQKPNGCYDHQSGIVIALDSNKNFLWQRILSPTNYSGIADVIVQNNNLILNAYASPNCYVPNNYFLTRNYQYSLAGDSIAKQEYSMPYQNTLPCKSYSINDNRFLLMSVRSFQGASLSDFAYQICDSTGAFISQVIHKQPVSCMQNHIYNTYQSLVQDPVTKNLVMLGSAAYYNAATNVTTQQPWIIFSDSVGCITPNCHQKIVGINNIESIKPNIYPNPSSGIFNISVPIRSWQVFNMQGQLIATGKSNNINLKNNNDGMYLLKIVDDNNVTSIIKLLKE
jgi:hypothetical protein